jgi:hypothetical protein
VLACADVVGYSRLMDADEADTLARITLTVRHCHRNFDRSQQARHSFFSITLSTAANNLYGSFWPNVLAGLPRRFSLSVPYWLPWTIVHLQRGGADDEDDFGPNPKYSGHEIHS